MSNYPVESKNLHVPQLSDVAKILQDGLSKNFRDAKVEVVSCPDLTQAPYGLAAPGLCGSPRVADVGGVPYLMPKVHLEKIYDLPAVAQSIELPDAFIVGAGAGPFPYVGVNSEMMPNLVTGSSSKNGSRVVKFLPETDGYKLIELPQDELRCALLLNLYASEGKPGNVIRVRVKQRTGSDNFVSCMRKTLDAHFGEQSVGMGGTFRLVKGSAKCHVMPKFSEKDLKSDDDVNNWLKFFNMPAPMVFLSVFVSRDPGLDLRIEHSHGFGPNCGGHYHYDVTPEEVEYEGYFNVAEKVFRVDRPKVTHMIGRD